MEKNLHCIPQRTNDVMSGNITSIERRQTDYFLAGVYVNPSHRILLHEDQKLQGKEGLKYMPLWLTNLDVHKEETETRRDSCKLEIEDDQCEHDEIEAFLNKQERRKTISDVDCGTLRNKEAELQNIFHHACLA